MKLEKDNYLAIAEVFAGTVVPVIAHGQLKLNQPYTFSCNFVVKSEEYTFISTMKLIKEATNE